MGDDITLLERMRAALRSEPRIGFDQHPIMLAFSNGDLVMEAELSDIAAKKLALGTAALVAPGRDIVDRLCVVLAQRMADGEIRIGVRNALLAESALSQCRIWETVKRHCERVREPAAPVGTIDIRVENAVVTLDGDVPGLAQKRLAGVLAWWVPGSRDVVNGLGVTPPETDNDDEITDSVRIALEKDPFVNADQVRVTTRHSVVTLHGLVPSASEREAAEFDAWYVFGVDKVVNEIEVRS